MHYSRHRLTASVTTWLHSRTRQPMTNGLALLAHWSVTSLCACLCRTGRPLCWDRCAESLRVELLVTKRQMARWWIVCEESADGSRCRWLLFRPQPPYFDLSRLGRFFPDERQTWQLRHLDQLAEITHLFVMWWNG